MITPMWRGWPTMADANSYGRFLPEELSPSMCGNPGFLGRRCCAGWRRGRPPPSP